jgi:hypothetical protein
MISAMHPGGAELLSPIGWTDGKIVLLLGAQEEEAQAHASTVIGEVHKDLGALTPFWPPSTFALVHNSLI